MTPDPSTEALRLADELRDDISFVRRPIAEHPYSAEDILRALAARLSQAEEALRETEHDNLVLAAWLREARKALRKIEAYGDKVNKAAEHRRIARAALAASSAGEQTDA